MPVVTYTHTHIYIDCVHGLDVCLDALVDGGAAHRTRLYFCPTLPAYARVPTRYKHRCHVALPAHFALKPVVQPLLQLHQLHTHAHTRQLDEWYFLALGTGRGCEFILDAYLCGGAGSSDGVGIGGIDWDRHLWLLLQICTYA